MQKKSSATDRFIHLIGHDCKQPLSLIRAYTYYIKKKLSSSDTDLATYTTKIEAQVDILAEMLDRISLFKKFEQGIIHCNLQAVTFSDIMEHPQDDIAALDSPVTFTGDYEKPLALQADPKFLTKALYYIIENAVLYSDADSVVTCDIGVHNKELVFTITNKGTVIPSAELDAVTKPYYQASNRQASQKGSGLGLTLADILITAHHGDLSLKSADTTTTVTITLPVAER